MSAQRLDILIWVLVYAGLAKVGLGLAVQRSHDTIGWSLVALGGLVAAAGVVLLWVRSRIPPESRR